MATTIATAAPTAREINHQGRGFWREAWTRLRRNQAAMAGLVIVIIFATLAILAPIIAPYHYADGDLLASSQGPSSEHWMGTDELGRDIFSRLLYGARVSLTVAIAAQIVIVVIGVPIGLLTGYIGGSLDMV